MSQPVEKGKGYTYQDYLTWNDGKRWEIIDGVADEKIEGLSVVSDMTPAPGRFHQAIVINLSREIGNYLKGKSAKVFVAPFDVRHMDLGNVNIVQPDVCIFTNADKLDDQSATGAPEWVIEILSPYSKVKDLGEKFFLYEKSGVKEYWVVDPAKKKVTVFILVENQKYQEGKIFEENNVVKSSILDDFEMSLVEIFAE